MIKTLLPTIICVGLIDTKKDLDLISKAIKHYLSLRVFFHIRIAIQLDHIFLIKY